MSDVYCHPGRAEGSLGRLEGDPSAARIEGGGTTYNRGVERFPTQRHPMAKPNYAFEKRQRELAKKAKKEEKRHRKTGGPKSPDGKESPAPAASTPPGGVKTAS